MNISSAELRGLVLPMCRDTLDHVMRSPDAAILVLSLSRIAPPVSPLLNAAPPYVKRTAAAATGQAGTAMLVGATHVTASGAARAAPSAGWITQRSCDARRRRPSTLGSWSQGSSAVHSARQEGRDSPKSRYRRVHTTTHVIGTRSRHKNHPRHKQQQQASRLGDEEAEGEERDRGEEDEGEESLTVSSRLQNVVDQLQGEIKAGATPQVRSRVQLDGLFAELRAESVPEGNTPVLRNSTTTAAAAAALPGAVALSTAPEQQQQQQQQSPSGTFTPASLPKDVLQESEDLESLSDMLDRVQANTKARDLAQAQAQSLAIRSGGPIGGDPKKSWVAIGNQRDMKTRFKRIREGRVGWAILPLLMKARAAGIPLSTGVYNAAIAAYSGTPKNYEEALRVLNMLRREQDPFVRPDLGSYNAAMWVCSEAGQWRLVMELMRQAREDGIEPDITSYNYAMKGLAIQKQWGRARKLLVRIESTGLAPDVKTYNGLVEAAGMGSQSPRQHMIEIVHKMEQAGVEPNSFTYTVLLNCLARRRKVFDGFQVMARLVDARAPLLPLGHRAGLIFCNAYGDWRRAMVLMEDMRVAKRRPSGSMYLLAVKACAKGGQWERALSLMVERRALDVREEKEASEKTGGRLLPQRRVEVLSRAKKRAARTHMRTLEAVLSAVSEAGQFEVAIRLVQQMRAAGNTPSKRCYLYTLRAASKWGRWDVIESLMKEMRALGAGVVDAGGVDDHDDYDDGGDDGDSVAEGARRVDGEERGEGRVGGGGGGGTREHRRQRVLSSDCYAPLVEAYAQASMWERAIEAYQEGYVSGREEAEPVDYRVYECVLKACVGAGDGITALEILRRQIAEPSNFSLSSAAAEGEEVWEGVSGGPPDRRCWCLAAEALGRAGMVEEGHRVLMAMVRAGIPLRESTKRDVPSLMPIPTGADGFEWHQRKRRRRPRRQQQGVQQLQQQGGPRLPPAGRTVEMQRDAAVSERLGTPHSGRFSGVGDHDGGDVDGGGASDGREAPESGGESSKKTLDRLEFPKGVVNGEGCTAAAVAAAATSGAETTLGMGWLLVNDLTLENSEMERGANEGGLLALERKRRRMKEFSRNKKEQQRKLERILKKAESSVDGRNRGSGSSREGTSASEDDGAGGDAAGTTQIDLRPGGRRGRDEALTLRMRVRSTKAGLLRNFGTSGGVRDSFDTSGRRNRRDAPLNGAVLRVARDGRGGSGDDGGDHHQGGL